MLYQKRTCFLGFLFIASLSIYAQNRTDLEGRIYAKDSDVAGTHIVNQTTQRVTITDVNGFFTIPVMLGDTLVFSAVQFKRKEIVVIQDILSAELAMISLDEGLTELDEVTITPYNLTGEMKRDLKKIKIKSVVTASTLGLPNAYAKTLTPNERRLFEADNGKFVRFGIFDSTNFEPTLYINLHKILNRISGRTQTLKSYVALDEKFLRLRKARKHYSDSVYINQLQIPKKMLDDFWYFCEGDSLFQSTADTSDPLLIWEFLEMKSKAYRKGNGSD